MKSKKSFYIIMGSIIVIIIDISFIWFGSYNKIVKSDIVVDEAYSNIQTQLQRRIDLIPNLVETVKGFASQEKEVIKSVSDARAAMMGAKTIEDSAQASSQVSSALGRLFSISEQYPDLKSNQNFIALQDQLEGTENRIAQHRTKYNESVKEYNTMVRLMPTSIVASIMNFDEKKYFEADEGADDVPEIDFGK